MSSLDLFTPVVPEHRLNLGFRSLAASRGYAPARAVMQQVMDRMGDRDGNLVQQFQTEGFDARTWELYLYAAFSALGFDVDMSHDAPDFLLSGRGTDWAVEATTANPSAGGAEVVPDEPDARAGYLREELPIRLGSPLLSKLRRAYWNLSHVAGKPFIVALQSFATEDSLHFADNAITDLLYGIRTSGERRANGTLEVISTPVAFHIGSKSIPSNFFSQPDRLGFKRGCRSRGNCDRQVYIMTVLEPVAARPEAKRYRTVDAAGAGALRLPLLVGGWARSR